MGLGTSHFQQWGKANTKERRAMKYRTWKRMDDDQDLWSQQHRKPGPNGIFQNATALCVDTLAHKAVGPAVPAVL